MEPTGKAYNVEMPESATSRLRLSVVVPVYNSANTLEQLAKILREELSPHYDLELVLVNDCSQDDSAEVCRKLARAHPWIRFVNLSRNFGEHNAVMAGLTYCSGDCAAIIDDDFQNPPSEVRKLVEKLRKGHDVVFSEFETKQHGTLRNLGSRFNNAVANIMLDKDRDLYLSSFKVINRFLIDEITRYSGPYPYIDGLILRTTCNIGTVLVEHNPREEGHSNYTLRKLVRLWLNMFTNFSILPLRVASLAGMAFAIAGLGLAVLFVIEKLNNPEMPAGWTSIAVLLLVVSGVQLFTLGVIGEYLGRLFLKDSGSPMFVANETMNCDTPEGKER